MTSEDDIRRSFHDQAEICAQLGSKFMLYLCRGLAENLDKSTRTGKQILEWQGDPYPKGDALALRLAGGLHALVRRGAFPPLQKYYENTDLAANAGFMPQVLALIEKKDEELVTWLKNAPQTNEVARSSIIYAGLTVIAERFEKPLSLFELGSSGGLNLQAASYGYQFSGVTFGNKGSDLQLNPDWDGGLPNNLKIDIVARRGCDLNPLSVENSQHCEKLISYLWPDQQKRIARVNSAIEIAKQNPPILEQADAADWVENVFVRSDGVGSVRVLFHTIAQNYFPQSVKDRIKAAVETEGAQVTKDNPLAWLSFEFEGDGDPILRLQSWPGGENRVLATADPHVYGVKWIN